MSQRSSRWHAKRVVEASDETVQQVGRKDRHGNVKVMVEGNSGYANTAERIAGKLQDTITRALTMKPCRIIDPSTVYCPPLTGIKLQRAIAKKKLVKHGFKTDFLRAMSSRSKRMPLTPAECKAVISICNKLEAKGTK